MAEPAPSPRTNWWPLSKQQAAARDVRKPPGLTFTSFASAIGLKSKKSSQPSWSQPSPPLNHVPRPPSNPASSTRSRVDSLEPRTPVDYHRERRHSLLTLSDTDPFAGRPLVAVPVPHLPTDPNRLSAYSNPSVTDLATKKTEMPTFNRVSYASSSSNSNNHVHDIPSPQPREPRRLHTKRSAGSLQVKRSDPLSRQTSITPSVASASKHETAPARPKLRARGMTDTGPPQTSGFFVDESRQRPSQRPIPNSPTPDSPVSPRVVVRQPSFTKVQSAPYAPPNSSLPATPYSNLEDPYPRQRVGLDSLDSDHALSTLALGYDLFASSFDYDSPTAPGPLRGHLSSATFESSVIDPLRESKTAPSSPRTLKKALSHSSLRKGSTPPSTLTSKNTPDEKKKQRNFHHPRLPIPPIPLPLWTPSASTSNSSTFPSAGDSNGSSTSEPRRTSTGTTRKRLFSNGSNSRPSTSQCLPASTSAEDDSLSLFSLRTDAEHSAPYKPWATTTHFPKQSSSFWDEGSAEAGPSSPVNGPTLEYMPQAIMSRDELAKFDASEEPLPEQGKRSRGFSILSASTLASEMDMDYLDAIPNGLSPPPLNKPGTARHASARMSAVSANSRFAVLGNNVGSDSMGPSRRPTTADPPTRSYDLERGHSNTQSLLSSAASTMTVRPRSPLDMASLPPPPRPRQRSTTSIRSTSSRPGTSQGALSPRPSSGTTTPKRPGTAQTLTRPKSATSMAVSRISTATAVSFSTVRTEGAVVSPGISISAHRPPSRKTSMRSKSSVEKAMHRRSIMRKPSFLDLDADTDLESDIDTSPKDLMFADERAASMISNEDRATLQNANATPTMPTTAMTEGSFLDFARESFDTARS